MNGICIVAHLAYGAMTGGRTGHFGGVERQTSLMARWLAGRGHRVSLLTWDEGQPDEVTIEGVRVIKMCRRDAGLPGIRFFHPRWTGLVKAMAKADANLYYQNCAEYVTGQVALWCRQHGRRFVYSVASDPDCDPRLPKMRTLRERVLYRQGLLRADRVIVQTHHQRRMLREGFGVDALALPMPCPDPLNVDLRPPHLSDHPPGRVLWVGRISRVKRLEVLLDVATVLPEVAFDIVGAADTEDAYSRDVLSRARGLANVTVHGRVQRDTMLETYRRAALLCCTSGYEGFPNTLLEAWSHGLPVVSTIDPDGLIARRGLGIVAEDKTGIAAAVRTLLHSLPLRADMSRRARQYYVENHTIAAVMPQFESLFLDLIKDGSRSHP